MKTKVLICAFVLAFAKSRFSNDAGHFDHFDLSSVTLCCVRISNTPDEYTVNIRSQNIVKLLKRQKKSFNMENHRLLRYFANVYEGREDGRRMKNSHACIYYTFLYEPTLMLSYQRLAKVRCIYKQCSKIGPVEKTSNL